MDKEFQQNFSVWKADNLVTTGLAMQGQLHAEVLAEGYSEVT